MGKNVDFVYVIDATGCMYSCIANVRESLHKINDAVLESCIAAEGPSAVDMLRVKFVLFRDYFFDGDSAMQESPFFESPSDDAKIDEFLNSVEAYGGGDAPENGLEGLYYALKSDFATSNGGRDRQIVVLITYDDAVPLKERACCENYPADMVDYEGLVAMCTGADKSIKFGGRNSFIFIFAPEGTQYAELQYACKNVAFFPTLGGGGLSDAEFDRVIGAIVAAATA